MVDIGCGTGANIGSLGTGYRGIGYDVSEEAVRHARERFPDATFVYGGVDERAAGADLFLLMDVLEHVERDDLLLGGAIERARPGAWIFITVPADPELWSEHDVSFGHVRRYTRETLRTLLEAFPLEIRLLCAYNSRLYPLALAVRRLARLRGRSMGPAGTDLVLPAAPVNAALRRILAGESGRLRRAFRGSVEGYRRGLSLIAVARVVDPEPTNVGTDRLGDGSVEGEPNDGRPRDRPVGDGPL